MFQKSKATEEKGSSTDNQGVEVQGERLAALARAHSQFVLLSSLQRPYGEKSTQLLERRGPSRLHDYRKHYRHFVNLTVQQLNVFCFVSSRGSNEFRIARAKLFFFVV